MEKLETLNERLKEYFGLFEDGRPNWKLVWSTDETEYRSTKYTVEGFELQNETILLLPKYPLQQDRFILERLIPVPEGCLTELTTKTSYEPIWTFEDAVGNPIAPDWDVIQILVIKVYANIFGPKQDARYKETNEDVLKRELESYQKTYEKLFGNESKITDSLALDSAVGYGVRNRKDWVQ